MSSSAYATNTLLHLIVGCVFCASKAGFIFWEHKTKENAIKQMLVGCASKNCLNLGGIFNGLEENEEEVTNTSNEFVCWNNLALSLFQSYLSYHASHFVAT
jgi:hypothetical protein